MKDLFASPKKLIWILLVVVATFSNIYLFYSTFFKKSNLPLISPGEFFGISIKLEDSLIDQVNKTKLSEVVQKALEGSSGEFGIGIKNLKNNESYFYNENHEFEPASLYKLWVMATVYQQIEEGKLQKEQILSQDIATLNQKFQIDPSEAEQTTGGITLTVEQSLEQMITISHNYAALLLSEKIRLSSVAAFLQKHDLNNSKVGTSGGSPMTNTADMVTFLEKLYQGELGNEQSTREMLELLKRQKLKNKLPKYFPEGVIIGHKTGELGTFSHDVGIVYTEKGDYIIAILSDSPTPARAEEQIAQISKAIYLYFVN